MAYTGTHDNETLVSWYQTISDAERAMVRDYLYDYATPDEQLYKSMIALILRSAAARCIIPMQDWLGLDNAARINKPSTVIPHHGELGVRDGLVPRDQRLVVVGAGIGHADKEASKGDLQADHPLRPDELGVTV